MKVAMIPSGAGYRIVSPYSRMFVADLKDQVPASDRYFEPKTYCWFVTAQYGGVVAGLMERYYGIKIHPQPITATPTLGIIELLYLGTAKVNGNGAKTASGWTENGWTVKVTEAVLKRYFDPSYTEQTKTEKPKATTYYEMLSVSKTATLDQIKSGYRRMVKQWHPDVCHDPDAAEVFRAVQKAYETLSDKKLKARYDVGLKMSETVNQPKAKTPLEKMIDAQPYRAPLKCGNLLCEYLTLGPMRIIQKILQWEDIYNELGQVLVSSWKMGDTEPTLEWS